MIHRLQKDDILYFLHVPKTAGTSFIAVLDNYFDLDSIYPHQTWHQFLQDPPKNFNYKLIRGHYGYGICKILPKIPICITMLRDPIDRTRSYYDHIHAYPRANHQLPDDYLLNKNSLLEVLRDHDKKKIFSNNQTRHIGVDVDGMALSKILGNTKCDKYAGVLETYPPFAEPNITDAELLKKAKKKLSDFAFVGLVEKYEESLFLLCYTFGWKPNRNKWKLMQTGTTRKEDLSKETMMAIQNCNQLDQDLYDFGKQIFEKRYNEMIKTLREKYFEKRMSNLQFSDMMLELLEKHYESNLDTENPQKFVDYNFSMALSGSGWHYREFSQSGNVYRWTGESIESSIDFHLSNKHDCILHFRITDEAEDNLMNSLKIFVNDMEIYTKRIQQLGDSVVYESIISKKILQNKKKITTLTFKVSHTIPVLSNNPPIYIGTRKIGLAFDQIIMRPTMESQLEEIDNTVNRFVEELQPGHKIVN